MDKDKITLFIKQLSKDTLTQKNYWRRLTDYENTHPASNKPIFNMLFQTEFRRIDFASSYYCIAGKGTIFVLLETNESGRDGTLTSGYKIYLHDENANKMSQLQCDSGTAYQLVNSIHSYLAKEEADAEAFIDDYLSQN